MQQFMDVLTIVSTLLMLVFILFLAYATTKWLGRKGIGQANGGGAIKILDRAVIGQNQSLLIVQVGTQTMLVAMSAGTAQKLCDIENPDDLFLDIPTGPQDFSSIFKESFKDTLKSFTPKRKDKGAVE